MRPPGHLVLAWATALFGHDVADRVFQPLVADWQHEWRAAPAGVARWRTWLSGWHAVFVAALMTGARMAAPWHADVALRRRGTTVLAAFSVMGTAVLMLPYLRYLEYPRRGLALLAALVPSCLAVAWSFGLLPMAMSCAAGRPPATMRSRLFVVGVTGVSVLALIVTLGWIGPSANLAWREGMAGRPVVRGLRELTLPELWSADARRFGDGAVAQEWRTRASVGISWPVTLALLGWRLGRRSTHSTAWRLFGWWLGAAIFVAVLDPRALGRDAPLLLAPLLWLLVAVLLRPRRNSSLAASR